MRKHLQVHDRLLVHDLCVSQLKPVSLLYIERRYRMAVYYSTYDRQREVTLVQNNHLKSKMASTFASKERYQSLYLTHPLVAAPAAALTILSCRIFSSI